MVIGSGSYGENAIAPLVFLAASKIGVVVMSNGGLSQLTAAFQHTKSKPGRADARDSVTPGPKWMG